MWRAGRGELLTIASLELLSGIGAVAEVVVGQRLLEAIVATQHTDARVATRPHAWTKEADISPASAIPTLLLRQQTSIDTQRRTPNQSRGHGR
jgi:hypothetical protein